MQMQTSYLPLAECSTHTRPPVSDVTLRSEVLWCGHLNYQGALGYTSVFLFRFQ